MIINKSCRLLLGIILAVSFLWLILRQITFEKIWKVLIGVDVDWVIAALLVFALGYACRIERWRSMIKRDNPGLEWGRCAGPLLAGFAVNNVLPFRAGDALRAFAFNKELGSSAGVIMATLFVERLLDLMMLLLLLGAAMVIFGLDNNQFAGIGAAALVLAALTILLILLFPGFVTPIVLLIGRLVVRFAPGFGQKLFSEINKSLSTLHHLAIGGTMFRLILWSIVVWLAEGCVFWFFAMALPDLAVPLASWLALPMGTLATMIPSTPGYIGTFDFFTAHAMATLGNDPAAAAAFALFVHALLWLWPTLLGGFYLIIHHLKKQEKLKGTSK